MYERHFKRFGEGHSFILLTQDPIKELKGVKRKEGGETPKNVPPTSGDPSSKDADKAENLCEPDAQTTRSPPAKRTKTDRDGASAKQQPVPADQSDSAEKETTTITDESGSPRRNPPRHVKRNSLIKEEHGYQSKPHPEHTGKCAVHVYGKESQV
jgi:hypothetical protein